MRNYKFNRSAHILLWTWLANELKNGNYTYTDEWPGWERNGGRYRAFNNCFACSYDNNYHCKVCSHCPLVGGCFDVSGRLGEAKDKHQPMIASKLALQMAYKEVRFGVECK